MEDQSQINHFLNQLFLQNGSNNNAALHSHANQYKESSFQHNIGQSLSTPVPVNEQQQQKNLLPEVNLDVYERKVNSHNSKSLELSKDVFHSENNPDSKENNSQKEKTANSSADDVLNYYLVVYQKMLINRKNSAHARIYDKPTYLCFFLNSILETLCIQPEAEPFLHPVDALKIQDYYDIIKSPMDLSTIRTKLTSGQYQSGWEFVDDIWLMFNNAWLYNKKNSRVYKNCSKLADLFSSIIDKPMRKLGYCCGQNYAFEPSYLFCSSTQNCIIPKYAVYWSYDRYQICKKCFSESQDKVMLERAEETMSINKEEFVSRHNDITKKELFVECLHCRIKCHKICVLHSEDIWKDGYICRPCLKNLWKAKVANKFTSENLPQTRLGSHIEDRVNHFLKGTGCNSKVTIRIVYQAKKTVDVKLGVQNRFVKTGIWPNQFPYTMKTLLAFQQHDQMDVCFFAMFMQEYDSECPYPNTNRVYISYLDSVHYFTPKNLRTSVYHEIFLGYLDYIRKLGYITAHLWSCPSKNGEDYVFHAHPKEQKNPSIKQLLSWYRTMLDKGIEEGVVYNFKDIYKQAVDSNLQSASELPYFEGDFWPNALENEISKLDGNKVSLTMEETELSMRCEKEDEKINDINDENQKTKCKRNKKKIKRTSNKLNHPFTCDPLTEKLFILMYRFREVFLVIHLEPSTSDLPAVIDPDPLISSDLMSSREMFLDFCRENNYEFSSLRRAIYSTMVFLYELHKEKMSTFYCNQCKKIIKAGVHCNVCQDFDLCSDCYNQNGHVHETEAMKVNSESRSYFSYLEKVNPAVFLRALNIMDHHLSICNNANCSYHLCKKLKYQIEHLQNCKSRSKYCFPCIYICSLVKSHIKRCKTTNCLICKRKQFLIATSNQKTEDPNLSKASAASNECDNITLSTDNFQSLPSNISNEYTDKRNAGPSLFSTSDQQLNGAHLSENWKTVTLSNVGVSSRAEDGTEPHINSPGTNGSGAMGNPEISAGNCQINDFISNNVIYSDFPKNSVLYSMAEQTLSKMPLNEYTSVSLGIVKACDHECRENCSTKAQVSHLLPEICSSDHYSTLPLMGKSIKNSKAYFSPQNSACFTNHNPKSILLNGIALDTNTSEMAKNTETFNFVNNGTYLIHSAKTDLCPDSQTVTYNINSSLKNSVMSDSLQNYSMNTVQKSLSVISDNHLTKSVDKLNMLNCGELSSNPLNIAPVMTANLNSLTNAKSTISNTPETYFTSQVLDSESRPTINNLTNQLSREYFPEAFSYDKDKNSLMYSAIKPCLQALNSVDNLKTSEHFAVPSSTKLESSSETLPGKPNPLSISILKTFDSGNYIKPENNSDMTCISPDLETFNSQLFTLDHTKNIKKVFKVPKNISYALPTYAKVGEKPEISINKSRIELDSSQISCDILCETNEKPMTHSALTPLLNLQTSNFGLKTNLTHTVRDIPRQITSSKVLKKKQSKTINIPTLFHHKKVLKKNYCAGNVYLPSGVQTHSSAVSNSTLTLSGTNISKASSDNHKSRDVYIHASENSLKQTNNVENIKLVNSNESSPKFLTSFNRDVPSAVNDDSSKNFRISGEKHNLVLDNNLTAFDNIKKISENSVTPFTPTCNSNFTIPPLTQRNIGNSANTFTEIPGFVLLNCKLVSSDVSTNKQVSVSVSCSKTSNIEHSTQTQSTPNFQTKYSHSNYTLAISERSEISGSKQIGVSTPKILDSINCTKSQNCLDKTVTHGFQTLNTSVFGKKDVAHGIPKIISAGPSVNSKQVQFAKISVNKPKPIAVEAMTGFKNCDKSDFFGNSQDFQSVNTVLLPPNNEHQAKSPFLMKDANLQGYSNQVPVQNISVINDKFNKNPVCSSEHRLNVNQKCVQNVHSVKTIPNSCAESNVKYFQPLINSQVGAFRKDDKNTYSRPNYSPAYQPMKFDSIKQHNYEACIASDKTNYMFNNKNSQISDCLCTTSEGPKEGSLVFKTNDTNNFENSPAEELNNSKLNVSSILPDKDNTGLIYTSQNKYIDSKNSHENLYFKIPVSMNNEKSSFTDLNSGAVSSVSIPNNNSNYCLGYSSVSHNATVMYLRSAGKINVQEATYNSTSNNSRSDFSYPVSVNLDKSTVDSAKGLPSQSCVAKQSQCTVSSRRHSPNILRKKYNSQNSSPYKYLTLSPAVNSIHPKNLSRVMKNSNPTCVAKNDREEISYLSSNCSSGIPSFVSCKQFVNQELKFVPNHTSEAVSLKSVESFTFSNPANSSDLNALSSHEKNFESHFSDSLLNNKPCYIDGNISNSYTDSQVKLHFQDQQKTSTSLHNASMISSKPNAYLMKYTMNSKDLNHKQHKKKLPSIRGRKKSKYDMKYVKNLR